MMERLTSRQIIHDYGAGKDLVQTYIFGHKWGPAYFRRGSKDYEDYSTLLDRLADIEDVLGDEYDLTHLRDLIQAEQEGRLVVLPCKIGDAVWLLMEKCKHAGKENTPWNSCNQYWENVHHKHMWGCAGKDDEGKKLRCEKKELERYVKQMEYSLVLYAPHIVLGKNLFLTRETAEEALGGGDG